MDLLEKAKLKQLESRKPPIAPKPIKKRDLKPPKPPLKKIPPEEFSLNKAIEKWTKTSSFQRSIAELIKNVVPQLNITSKEYRYGMEALNEVFIKKSNNLTNAVNIYEEIEQVRGTHQDFRDVVKELKDKLAKRKANIKELT